MRKLESFATAKRAAKRPKSVVVKTFSTEGGAKVKVLSVDANSASFGDDFLYAFKHNVRRARQENKDQLGSAAGVRKGS